MTFASIIAYIMATLVVIGTFAKIAHKSWGEILIIKKTDFQDYKNILYKIRQCIQFLLLFTLLLVLFKIIKLEKEF